MASRLSAFNTAVWERIETICTPIKRDLSNPLQDDSSVKKVALIAKRSLEALVMFPLGCVTGSLFMTERAVACLKNRYAEPTKPIKPESFERVLEDPRKWDEYSDEMMLSELLDNPPGKNNPDFLYGVGTCTYQDSGSSCPDSQWEEWQEKCLPLENRSGKSANLFYLYEYQPDEVINRLKLLGVNSYRFSIEWSHIEPRCGYFDMEKLKIYKDFCTLLKRQDIKPMITLHHFSEPKWFHEKGSFSKEENIKFFTRFAEYVTNNLINDSKGPLVETVCTINEPAVEAFNRYVMGAFSPGKKFSFGEASNFLRIALKAHCLAYSKIKAILPTIKVGFTHQYLHFVPKNPLMNPATRYLNRLFNDITLDFFRTGIFEAKFPFSCNIVEDMTSLEPKVDVAMVQYYVRPVLGFDGSTKLYKEESMTTMNFREDPAGLYKAIIECFRTFHAPVDVTENGISTHDEKQRARYMLRALYALLKASDKIGEANVIGYHLWCFVRNLEWSFGMKPQDFGAFSLEEDPEKPKISKIPKAGIEPYMKVINAWREHFEELHSKSA